jgi:hypothetical protein
MIAACIAQSSASTGAKENAILTDLLKNHCNACLPECAYNKHTLSAVLTACFCKLKGRKLHHETMLKLNCARNCLQHACAS